VESKILELAATQGVWSALSVGLIYYILKNQEKRDLRQEERESKYQDIITTLSEKFNVVEGVKKNVEEIKVILEK
jgi:hypothetical protein